MTPKKSIIERAKEDGTLARVNQLLSAAHVLRCEAANLIGETADLLESRGLLMGELKKCHSDLDKVQDRYFYEFTRMITTEQSGEDLFADCDEFDKGFRKWAKL